MYLLLEMRKLLIIISFILIHFFSCGNKNVFLYGEECKTITLSKARVNPHTKILLASYKKQLIDLYTLDYREIPKEIERNILARIQHKNEGYFLNDHTPNPFADIKAKTRYKTLSNGLFDEMHEAMDTIQYYHALLNTKTKKIIQLLHVETDNEYNVDPVVFALSVDPLSDKYPNISPYAYCAWNPIVLTDPDGRDIKPISISENKKLIESLGKFSSVFTLSTYNGKYNVGGASGEYGTCNIISTTTSSESFRRKLEKSNLTLEEKTQARALYPLISAEDIIEIGTIDSKTTMNKSSVTSSNDFEYCATTNATAKDLINNKSKTQDLIQGILGAQSINSLKNDNIMPYGFFPESDQKTSVDNHGGVFRGLLLINPDDNTHDSSNESYINTIVDFSKKYYIQKNSNEN
jgi:hypothetical protein